MRSKKRKASDSASKRTTRKKVKEGEIELETKIPALPALTEENHYFDDDHMKTRLSLKVDDKNLKIVLPKVKITCVPLNVEKVIDFESNSPILDEVEVTKSNPEKKSKKGSQAKSKKSKNARNRGEMDANENFLHGEPSTLSLTKTRNKVNKVIKVKKMGCADASPLMSSENKMSDDSNKKNNTEILASESKINCKKQLVFKFSSVKEADSESQSFQISSNQNYEEHSNNDLGNETVAPQEFSDCLSFCGLDDDSALMEFSDVNLEEFEPTLEEISSETLKIIGNENNAGIDNEAVASSNISLDTNNSTYLRCKDLNALEEVRNDLSQLKSSLQAAVENFMSHSQQKCLKEISTLKNGLCLAWLSNNYVCANQQCIYSHDAVKLFTKKMRTYPSKFILNIVVSVTNDNLFVDVIMAAFKILSSRKIPAVWVTFLIYFVFYVTEPSDSRFLKFWANAARFYCQLGNEYKAAKGFASLLSVFCKGDKSEIWKIIEFIKLIKQPPIQVGINYELLQPVLKLDLPAQFLAEAVESCIATQKDVLKVYLWIVPKFSFMTSPIQTIELLLKFSKTLEGMDLNMQADDLKRRLCMKVKSFKTKITHYDYPLTAAFQEDIFLDLSENNGLNVSESNADPKKQSENMHLEAINCKSNYFQLENDFYTLMVEALELTCAAAAPDTVKFHSLINRENNEVQNLNDVCARQISRIQQFFSDCQFDLLGKYLNDLKPNILEQAAEEFLKFLFQMKISLQQGVDLVRIILLQCKTDSAAKIIASVCITLILNLVRINEWDKAYKIVSLCQEKQVNLIEGKVSYFNDFNTISQCRIVLLLIEINAYSGNYQRAMMLIKNHFLFSSNSSLWKLTWKSYDESIRIRIIEDFLRQVISKQLAEIVYELFVSIWKEQKQLNGVVDLRKFVNEVIIILLNEGNEEAVTIYEKVKAEVQLNDTTLRAILVTLVRLNHLSAAKRILISATQNVYSFPHVISGTATMMISSSWLEEEIYIVFDAFLQFLASKKRALMSTELENLEINIQILRPNLISTPGITPLCLGIINPAFKDTCNRIQRVLYQFSPPLKLIVMPYHLKLDEYSLQVNLYNRVCQNSRDH